MASRLPFFTSAASFVIRALRFAGRRPLGRLAVLTGLLLGMAFWYVSSRGGWDNALHLSPALDASTPCVQNGFTLLDVQRPGYHQDRYGLTFIGFQYEDVNSRARDWTANVDTADAFGIWLKAPPGSLPSSDLMTSDFGIHNKALSVTARLSTGDILPLNWQLCNQGNPLPPGVAAKSLVFVSLPAGYSDNCRSVDIAVADQNGHAAHWLFSRLPQMRRAVSPPAVTTETRNGAMMSALAWHPAPGQSQGYISYLLRPVLPSHSHQWDVVVTEQSREWMAYGDTGQVPAYTGSGVPIVGPDGKRTVFYRPWYGGGVYGLAGYDFYPRMTHFLRLACTLRQFETYDESVTFHNLPVQDYGKEFGGGSGQSYRLTLTHPLSIMTPTGVVVTLPVQGGRWHGGNIDASAFNFLVTAQPRGSRFGAAGPLPDSPLARTFGKPVQISLAVAPSIRTISMSYESSDGNTPASFGIAPTYLLGQSDMPPLLKNLTLIVHQRVNLQSIPMTFTLPIADTAPPYYPPDFKVPVRL